MKRTITLKLTVDLEIADEAVLIAAAAAKHPEVEDPFDIDTALLWLLWPEVEDPGPGAEILEVGIELSRREGC